MALPIESPKPRRALIIKPSALGDVVTALPVLRGLRRTFGPDLHVAWLLSRPCAPLVADDGDLDEVIDFDRRRLGRMWRSPAAFGAFVGFCRSLRRGRFDWVIDLQGLFRSGLFAMVSRAKVRAGFATARELAPLFYSVALPAEGTPTHTVDRNIALAKLLGIDARPEDFRLSVSDAARQWADEFIAERGRDYIVAAPATRWVTKLYPTRHWRQVVGELTGKTKVVLVGAPNERHLTESLADIPGVVDLGGRTTVPQLVALIDAARALVSCDSATMNIATAVGTPQVTLLGPTNPARTGPYGVGAGLLQTSLPCRACLKRQCPHITCMETIRPQVVVEAVAGLLG